MAGALNIFQKKPYIEADKCVRCKYVCSCPVPGKAVDFRKGKGKPPVYDYRKCIRCLLLPGDVPEKSNQSEVDEKQIIRKSATVYRGYGIFAGSGQRKAGQLPKST